MSISAYQAYKIPQYSIVRGNFEIMPGDISPNFNHLWEAFDHNETEISAAYILRYCRRQGSWAPFSYKQINVFYRELQKRKHGAFTFNRLVEPGWHEGLLGDRQLTGGGWIVHNPDDRLYYVTDDFIRRVHKSITQSRSQ